MRQPTDTRPNFTSKWQGISAIILGGAAICVTVWPWFPGVESEYTPAEGIIFSLLGSLLIVVGVEHLTLVNGIRRHVQEINLLLHNIPGGTYLHSWEMVYDVAKGLVATADSEVLATSFGKPDKESSRRKAYYEALAKRASELRENNQPLQYKVIVSGCLVGKPMSGPLDEVASPDRVQAVNSPDRFKELIARRAIFRELDVEDSIEVYTVAAAWGVNLLIVDRQHVIIGFSSTRMAGFMVALYFQGNPHLGQQVANWYDQLLLTSDRKKVKWVDIERLAQTEKT